MIYKYLAQDEYNVLNETKCTDGKKLKDPVTITINIEIEKDKYNTISQKYKVSIGEKILALFK